MYSWGDDAKAWKNPGAYDFGSARRAYANSAAAKAPRSYSVGNAPDMKIVDPKGKDLTTESQDPVIIAVDGTGSMQHWPAEIFDRLPLLDKTLLKYKPDAEICFSVIGDAFSDQWPLQVAPFGKGPTLDDRLKALFPEGNGGGQHRESYELWAYFMQNHVKTPKATSPFMIIMGDEGFYEKVNPDIVRHYIGDKLEGEVDAKEVWKSLAQRFNVYLLHKPYDTDRLDKEIVAQWGEALGRQKVVPVYDATRIVDVAMGIIARHWGKFDDFTQSLSARQDSTGIATVMKSLRYVPDPDPSMNSVMKTAGGARSKKLA